MYPLAMTLCLFCSVPVGRAPFPDIPREAGGIVYRHEILSGTHLLRLSTTDLILDSDAWRERRLLAFATSFAERTCRGRFRITDAVRLTTTVGQFSFRCR
jgi:hypothetical protein